MNVIVSRDSAFSHVAMTSGDLSVRGFRNKLSETIAPSKNAPRSRRVAAKGVAYFPFFSFQRNTKDKAVQVILGLHPQRGNLVEAPLTLERSGPRQ